MSHKKISLFARFPVASALRETFAEGYGFGRFKKDLSAGFVVSLVALPLSMALAIAVGLAPQHGLYTAIVAGIVVALLGGSKVQVTGPTAAFVVILAPIVAEHGLHGLIWCQILAGVFLLIFAAARLGKLISYVPYTVVTGFTAGIALILGVISLNDFLGLGVDMPKSGFTEQVSALFGGRINGFETLIGVMTLGLVAWGGKITKLVPSSMLAVGAAILLSLVFQHFGHSIDTIATRFSYVALDGAVGAGIPPYPPVLHMPSMQEGALLSVPTGAELSSYVYPALIIAVLAALESLLSATVADSMMRTRHQPTAELNGLGLGNIVAAFCAGIPATGALARTAAMVHSGGTSPFASVFHALFLLAYMVVLAPLIGYMPMSALAAVLVFTAYRMSHWQQCLQIIKIAPRAEVVVLLSVFAMTVVVDMVAGIAVGMAMSTLLLMQRVSEMTTVERHHYTQDTPLEKRLLEGLPESVMYFRVTGPLFFSTTQRVLDQGVYMSGEVSCVVIDLMDVDFIDMSGLAAMKVLVEGALARKTHVILVCPPKMDALLQAKLKLISVARGNVSYLSSKADALMEAQGIASKAGGGTE